MCHHASPNAAVYQMGCLMSPCPAMSPINDLPAGSLFVHHPQVNGCGGMIPGVFYNPGYGGGACIPVSSVDSGYECCETTSGGFSTTNDPNCARDSVTLSGPNSTVSPHLYHRDGPLRGQPHATNTTKPHHSKMGHMMKGHGKQHGGGKAQKGKGKGKHSPPMGGQVQPTQSVKPSPGHAYYIQNAVLCTMRFPPGNPKYTQIMCTAQCNEQFVFSGPSPDGNLAIGSIGGSPLCHGETSVPWSCIMSTPDC